MDITAQEYQKLSQKSAPRSPVLLNCLKAFGVGGGICAVGQLILFATQSMGLEKADASFVCSVVLVFLSITLTGFGLYERLAKHAGAGTLVPITGFANAMSSPAIEFKTEGLILGLGVKMFTIAGPVLTYGVVASVIYGLLFFLVKLI